jgi:hypothetical protein
MPTTAQDPVLVGAGDIANCASNYSSLTAPLLQNIPGTIFTAGDNANPDGSTDQFNNCFNATWGQFKSRIKPAAGNHDYMTAGAAPYYAYFGSAAGDPQKGYYSYDLGTWHIIVLNSQCTTVGSCKAGYPEEQWLLADLKAHTTNRCTLAVWHIPRFSSGHAGNHTEYQPFWQDLYNYGAEIVIDGHDHDYERFALQDPSGNPDPQHGIREFVVGTGGDDHTPFNATPAANSQVRISYTFGVLQLNLHPGSYDWKFIPVAGQTLSDAGSGVCH